MTSEMIQTAQDYLTVLADGNGKKRKIVAIDQLLRKHPPREVIDFLKIILKEKQDKLRDLILLDKTRPEIDEMVAIMFRITLAIKTIEDGKEVRDVDRPK